MIFRRPLGLVLAGGGSHAAWQAGCLEALALRGLAFDKILAISGGCINALAYFLDRMGDLRSYWHEIDRYALTRLAPRLRPFSLFSDAPLWKVVSPYAEDRQAKRQARCEFIAVSLRLSDRRYHYARFTPGGKQGWDGPLAHKIIASCAVRWVFPPVKAKLDGEGVQWLVDGGTPGKEWIRFDSLSDCKDVLVVQMNRPEQIGRQGILARWRGDQGGVDLVHGVNSLFEAKKRPRVFRFYPSAKLAYSQFSFTSKECVPAFEFGRRDSQSFLEGPERFILPRPLPPPAG